MPPSFFAPAAAFGVPLTVRDLVGLPFDWVARAFVCFSSATKSASWDAKMLCLGSSSSSEVISTHPIHLDLSFFGGPFLIAIPLFARTTCPLLFSRSRVSIKSIAAVFPSFGNMDIFATVRCFCISASVFDFRLHRGQSQSPEGSSVTQTHSQWCHPTGQSSLSQQIQFPDASGVSQVHL